MRRDGGMADTADSKSAYPHRGTGMADGNGMGEHEQRLRDACLGWSGEPLDDRDIAVLRVCDLRALLRDLDEARAERDTYRRALTRIARVYDAAMNDVVARYNAAIDADATPPPAAP